MKYIQWYRIRQEYQSDIKPAALPVQYKYGIVGETGMPVKIEIGDIVTAGRARPQPVVGEDAKVDVVYTAIARLIVFTLEIIV